MTPRFSFVFYFAASTLALPVPPTLKHCATPSVTLYSPMAANATVATLQAYFSSG
jgi:hypothetical protein